MLESWVLPGRVFDGLFSSGLNTSAVIVKSRFGQETLMSDDAW
jgi:hypothetical protein